MIAVTKLVDLLDKPFLVYWANKIGLEGTSLKEYRLNSQNKGTNKHKEIELYFKEKKHFTESHNLEKLLKGFNIIGSEFYLNNGFIHGVADLVCETDGVKIVIDFKSTDTIYLSQKLQLSTYKEILNADKIAIINFKTWELKYIDIDTKYYFEIIKRLYQVNELLNKLNERL